VETVRLLGIDLGAESGRAMLGTLEAGRLALREVHRFPNGPLALNGHAHWNVYRLYEEILASLRACRNELGAGLSSLGIDTWGLDYGLLTADGALLGLPYTYRDGRTAGVMEEFCARLPAQRIYQLTGIQFMPINTLYQLAAWARRRSPATDAANALLFMPDLFHYFLTGRKCTEFSMATTSQLYNPWTQRWESEIFAALGVSPALMQEILPPGAPVGALSPEVCLQTGLPALPVIAPATHDTGSAVAATPADGEDWAYISSGTWSLMGVEMPQPICSEAARAANFTNEGGVAGTFRFLKNVMGLWLVQQCRRSWAIRQEMSYAELTQLAAEAAPFRSILSPDWSGFLNPPDMPAAIDAFCAVAGQPAPASPGQYVRAILESLALAYRRVLEQLEQVTGKRIATIHIVGGGSRSELLCQFTANATRRVVLAGPVEATAMGNVLTQAMALGKIASLADLREVVRRSCEVQRYEPAGDAGWDAAYRLFRSLDAEQTPS